MGAAGSASGGANPAQTLARLAMDTKKFGEDNPETAPMMRKAQEQFEAAMRAMIEKRAATLQTTPPI